MRMMLSAAVLAMAGCSTPAPESKSPEAAVEQFMWDYTKAWNKHDAAAVAQNFYRLGRSVEE